MHCKLCNYTTDDRRNFARHLKTKKHLLKFYQDTVGDLKNIKPHQQNNMILKEESSDEEKEDFTCYECDKTFKEKRYLYRHQKYHCHKIKQQEKDEVYLAMVKNNEKLQEQLINQNQKVEEKNGAIQKILIEGTKALQKNNNKIYDMSMKNQDSYKFILEHFKEAPDIFFPKDIEQQLFENMGKYMEMENPVAAISKAFLDFIPQQPQEERFIHGIDISRVKYVVKKDGKWNVDYYAKEVIPKFVYYFKKSCGRYVEGEMKKIEGPKIYDRIAFLDKLDSKILSNKVARNVSFDLQLNKEQFLTRMIELNRT